MVSPEDKVVLPKPAPAVASSRKGWAGEGKGVWSCSCDEGCEAVLFWEGAAARSDDVAKTTLIAAQGTRIGANRGIVRQERSWGL